MQGLTFDPLIPPALWVTLLVLVAALLAAYGLRRPARISRVRWVGALALTTGGAALVLVVLLNPTWVQPVPPPPGKPLLTLLVDRSASMATPDVAGGAARLRAAAELAGDVERALGGQFEVRTLGFDAAPRPADLADLAQRDADGPLTNLAAALRGGLEGERPPGQAVALLSDGIHNAGDVRDVLDAARLADGFAAPVYTRTFGGQEEVRDLALGFVSAQELAASRQSVSVRIVVRQRGFDNANIVVTLRQDQEEIARQEVRLPDAAPHELRFDVRRDEPGLYRYEATAEPLAGEVTQLNNAQTFVLRVVDQPIRVLLLEGKPYWDAKFLVRALAADPLIELRSLVRLTDNRFMERTLRRTTATAPASGPVDAAQDADARPEEWRIVNSAAEALGGTDALRDTQIVVLGRDAEVYLTEELLAQLRNWIARDGGSLVCYRGAPVTQVGQQLAQLLPVHWAAAREARFHPQWTEHGRDLRWLPEGDAAAAGILNRLPTLAAVTRVDRAKPLAVVLAAAEVGATESDTPVVTYQPYGAGRVVVIEGAGMWRWAFLAPPYREHDTVYAGLWHSMLRWLVSHTGLLPGQTMALRTDKVTFGAAESCSATLLLRQESAAGQLPTIELTGDALPEPRALAPTPLGDEPDAYRVVFGTLPEGRYHARVVSDAGPNVAREAAFDVRSFLEEKLDVRARPDLMQRIAELTGGAVLGDDPAAQIRTQFREYLARTRPPRATRLTAWDRWWLLALVWGAWTAAWALRRSGGLI